MHARVTYRRGHAKVQNTTYFYSRVYYVHPVRGNTVTLESGTTGVLSVFPNFCSVTAYRLQERV